MDQKDAPPHSYVMVLNDGETFTNIVGCQIRVVADVQLESVMDGEKKISEVGFAVNEAIDNMHGWYWTAEPTEFRGPK